MAKKDDVYDREKANLAKYNNLLQKHKQLINEKMIFTNFLEREWNILSSKYPSTFERGLMNYPYKSLELTQKYDVVRKELENANNHWKKFEINKDELTDELLAKNQEIMNSIKDIKMEVYELNRKIDIQSENPKTGKINAEIFEKYYAEKWKKLDALIKKYTDQNSNLKKQIIQAKKKLEKKDKSEFII
jgi:DNA repair exonuclease SbcCD nuclease subunit